MWYSENIGVKGVMRTYCESRISSVAQPAREILDWFEARLAEIPPELREAAEIVADPDSDWWVSLQYLRPLTVDEQVTADRAAADADNCRRELELRKLAELQAKYPGVFPATPAVNS